jgi:hypothetical protein
MIGNGEVYKMRMKTFVLASLFSAAVVLQAVEPAFAGKTVIRKGPRRTTVVHKGPHRKTVVVHRHFPLRRALPAVVVRPARFALRVAPAVFVAPVVWVGTVAAVPDRSVLVWEGAETLAEDDDWTEFALDVNSRGRKLYIEIVTGRAQLNFAEVVFENGDTQVVDFNEKTKGVGLYTLLDFKDGRTVDHVRVVARAKSDSSRVVVRMAK